VINHTGPVTDVDTLKLLGTNGPSCDYQNYQNTTACTLVANLPDIRTESTQDVDLPPFLVEKMEKEGRYDQEMQN
jgi:alpha-amylase